MACSEWNVPFLPVNPWTITLVFLSTNTAGSCAAAAYRERRPGREGETREYGVRIGFLFEQTDATTGSNNIGANISRGAHRRDAGRRLLAVCLAAIFSR